jgi:hypothetical protein
VADFIFNDFLEKVGDGTHDMDNDTFYIALYTSSYTPDATDAVLADLSGEVANGNGYTTGGQALTSVTWVQTAGTLKFDAADASWTTSTITARYAVIYNYTAASKNLVCLRDFGSDQSSNNGTLTVQFNASGILDMTEA